MNTPPQTDNHSAHLFSDVPFHQLLEKDLTQMNEAELAAFIKTTRATRVSPSVRKSARTAAAGIASGKRKAIKVETDLSHLL